METVEKLNSTDVKKELYKTGVIAEFQHYCEGFLVYNVVIRNHLWQFKIAVVEWTFENDVRTMRLSSDLGHTVFGEDCPAKHLIRWIDRAITDDTIMFLMDIV